MIPGCRGEARERLGRGEEGVWLCAGWDRRWNSSFLEVGFCLVGLCDVGVLLCVKVLLEEVDRGI